MSGIFDNDEQVRELAKDIAEIQKMSAYQKSFLYENSAEWCDKNFDDYYKKFYGRGGIQITAIVDSNHENGLIKAYLRNFKTEKCFDVRGEFATDQDILRYTGIDYESDSIEKFTFDSYKPFRLFLRWLDFEKVKEQYQFYD